MEEENKRPVGRPKKETPQANVNVFYDIRPDIDLMHRRCNDLAMGQNEINEKIEQIINYLSEKEKEKVQEKKPEPIPEPVKPEVKPVFEVPKPAETEKPRGLFGFRK